MAATEQPSQVLPSWLSLSTFHTTDASGAPTTEATIVFLPLTYFGPSIPLGTNGVWVFGGSTSPGAATSTTTTTTSHTPIPTSTSTSTTHTITSAPTHHSSTSATFTSTPNSSLSASSLASTSTLVPFPSSSSPVGSSSIAAVTSSVISSAPPSSSSSTTSVPSPEGAASGRTRTLSTGAIIAISILSFALAILILFLCFLLYRRRNRTRQSPRGLYSTASWSGFEIVDAEAGAEGDQNRVHPGTGDGEQDPFADPSSPEITEAAPPYAAPPRLVTTQRESAAQGADSEPPSAGTSRNSAAPVGIALAEEGDAKSLQSSTFSALMRERSGPNASDASLFYRTPADAPPLPNNASDLPSFALSPPPRMAGGRRNVETSTGTPIEPPQVLNHRNRLSVSEPLAHLQNSTSSSRSTMPSMAYPDSPISDIDESAALMTARRVRVESVRTSNDSILTSAIGASIARLGRLSWFNRSSSGARSEGSHSSRARSFAAAGSMEVGLMNEEQRQQMSQRNSLPASHSHRSDISGTSGQSVYYDAPSRPRSPMDALADAPLGIPALDNQEDVLDIPAPPSAMTSMSSSSARPDHLSFPPGLQPPWRGSLTRSGDRTGSSGSSFMEDRHLDDEPPRVGERWDRIRAHLTGGGSEASLAGASARRGYAIHGGHSTHSEQASLHSMRSHVRNSPHSAGSKASSHRSGPSSNSSRGGAASSLNYSNSISSDGRRRVRHRGEAGVRLLPRTSMHAVGRRSSESPLVSTTTISDPSTGAVMHFPSHVWQPHQGAAEWPEDAWTESPEGGARWWGPPSSLQVYRSHTGDER